MSTDVTVMKSCYIQPSFSGELSLSASDEKWPLYEEKLQPLSISIFLSPHSAENPWVKKQPEEQIQNTHLFPFSSPFSCECEPGLCHNTKKYHNTHYSPFCCLGQKRGPLLRLIRRAWLKRRRSKDCIIILLNFRTQGILPRDFPKKTEMKVFPRKKFSIAHHLKSE